MKISELLETPQLEPIDLPHFMHRQFHSNRSINSLYNMLKPISNYCVGISKDNSYAFIGELGIRQEDQVAGAYIYGHIEFKDQLNVSSTIHVDYGDKVLQVDGVEIVKEYKNRGIGYYLYLTLIHNEYTIICDNLQYLGGQAIWKKIASQSINNQYNVYIIDDEELLMKNGQPVKYDGSNIDDCEIWSTCKDKVYTLLVATKH